MGVWYATREDVKTALDAKETARNNGQVDRAIAAATPAIEGLLHRRFYPSVATRSFPWPDEGWSSRPWRLWLDADELISATTLTSGATTIAATDYLLEPANAGPPYNRIEINLAGSAAFTSGVTHQRAISIAGVWGGCPADEDSAGTLAAAVTTTTATTVDVSDSAAIGVGHLIRVDTERMLVTDKTMLTTGQTLQTPLTANAANVAVAVTNGAAYTTGEVLLLDSERMLVVDIAGNTLTVKRAWDGSVLAAHTGSTIYAARRLTVTRAALGTTAATHLSNAAVARHVVPDLVHQLAVAEAINSLLQETAGYARTVGSGEGEREAGGRGLRDLREQAYTAHARKARMRVI
jgi:hypothetical protein